MNEYEYSHSEKNRYIEQWLLENCTSQYFLYCIFISKNPRYPEHIDFYMERKA